MCGRINVTDDPFVKKLSEALGIKGIVPKASVDTAPGAKLSIVRTVDERRVLDEAIWWLCLDPKTLKPNYKYASFNSRSDKLNVARSLAFQPYRESRCVIPASGFVEGLGDKKTYFHLKPTNNAIAFGGLYKEWIDQTTGELLYSASIITLPPHPKLQTIHPKSIPLMLPINDTEVMDAWLDESNTDVRIFEELMTPKIRETLVVTPIDRPSSRVAIGDAFEIEADIAA